MRTFDDLIRTALVDIATRAEPVDLTDAALADAARQHRFLIPAVAASSILVFGAGLLMSFTSGDGPPGQFQPDGHPASPHHSTPASCATLSPGTPCAVNPADAGTTASQSPSPTPSRSRKATTSPDPSVTPSVDNKPGNRPRPKPTKPGRGDSLDVSVIPDGL